jgi:transcriptional regulator with XRE-family HTH domain
MSSVLYEGRAKISVSEDIAAMNQEWRNRLASFLEDRKLSKREVSLAAGMGPGYIHSILKEGKDPGVESLIKVCDTLGITLSWLLYGFDIGPEDERLLQQIQNADPQSKEALLTLLRSAANQNHPQA